MGHVQATEVLLEHGALMEFTTNKGDTARAIAVQAGHTAVTRVLDEMAEAERSISGLCHTHTHT